jgi:hypothetical protein
VLDERSAHQAGNRHPAEQTDNQHDRDEACAEEHGQQDQHEELRNSQHSFSQTHQQAIHHTAKVARRRTQQHAHRQRQDHGKNTHSQRNLAANECACQLVAAQIISPERMYQ